MHDAHKGRANFHRAKLAATISAVFPQMMLASCAEGEYQELAGAQDCRAAAE